MVESPATTVLVLALMVAWSPGAAPDRVPDDRRAAMAADSTATSPAAAERSRPLDVRLSDEAFGLSGALRIRIAMPGERLTLPLEWSGTHPASVAYRWIPVLEPDSELLGVPVEADSSAPDAHALRPGDRAVAPAEPGVYELELGAPGASRVIDGVRLVVQTPFHETENGRIGEYFIGRYPEVPASRRDHYARPIGFIEVTRANRDLRLSEHFRLSEFLTHDQRRVWPKYVVVQPQLLDKLELVMDELERMGIRADDMVVMSGYRTPQYNRRGLGQGRAVFSRHQYGDAADVWVDSDGDWYMDDLNGDGERDTDDARVLLGAVDRVEARHPELIGGAGVYDDNGVHGPFVHIDARGYRARW